MIPELPTTVGPYRVLRTIGEGGAGRVFAAVHEHLGRRVALKVLSGDAAGDPQMVARFLQEGRALEQLGHPGIVRVYDCGKLADGTAYLAMEHVEGEPLDVWMRRRGGAAALDVALAIAGQIAGAMVEVHERGIVHRDLKPANVLLTEDETAPLGWRPTVVDFGIAKVPPPGGDDHVNTHLKTADHDVLGTAAYMAPEQCQRAQDVTAAADVYALGVMLFELVAGRLPFTSTDAVELLFHHVTTPPPHLCDLVPGVPPLLGTFVASMLAKAPEERPAMSRCRDMLSRPWRGEGAPCPFPGLQPFSEAQAELFFGREAEAREIASLLSEMREDGGRVWLQIEGLSGAGKSSLVQAGVLPALAGQPWIVAVLRLSDDPVRSLAQALVTACAPHGLAEPPDAVGSALRTDRRALRALVERHVPRSTPLLLVIEQLEELFALGGAHVAPFDALLSDALSEPAAPLRLLTTLRSDYIHRMEQAPGMARLLNGKAARYHLHPMREEGLAQVVLGMASRAGMPLSRELAERMVRDAASAEGRLPLLGHALRSLWSARAGSEPAEEQYERMGGVGGALAREATLLFEALGEEGRERAKWLLLDLVQVGRGAPDTRRARTRAEVLAAAGGDAKAEEVLARLAAVPVSPGAGAPADPLRLVVISGAAEDPAAQRVDLVHETLLQKVPLLVAWIREERALLERRADLEEAAQKWERLGRPADGLPSGSLLDHYRGYAGDGPRRERLSRLASERARTFLGAAARLERRRLWFRRAIAAVLAAAVAAISLSALIAHRERERAEHSAREADRERERAEKNLKALLATTDEIVSGADWKLGRLGYTVEIRRTMLRQIEDALSAPQYRDRPEARRALVRTKHRRSDLARLNGTLAEARLFIDDARAMLDADLKRDPADPDLRKLLALNLSKRGKIALARGLHAQALQDFERSVAEMPPVGSDDEADDRRTLATSHSEQADAEAELGRLSGAEGHYEKAARLLERNAAPGEHFDRSLLAFTLAQQADVARARGDLRAAAALLDRAKPLQEEAAAAEPGNLLYKLYLGRIHASLAAVRAGEGDAPEAARLFALAVTAGERLHDADPTQKDYGLLLCQSLQGAEEAARDLGDAPRSRELRERRCDVARRFVALDGDDVRFRRFACP